MVKLGITESYKLKRQTVLSASEAAEMIIRYVDSTRRVLVADDDAAWMTSCVPHLESAGPLDMYILIVINTIHRRGSCTATV